MERDGGCRDYYIKRSVVQRELFPTQYPRLSSVYIFVIGVL